MTDDAKLTPDSPDPDATTSASHDPVDDASATTDAAESPRPRRRFGRRDDSGRPFSLYVVLGVGVASLLILLGIIYWTSLDRENPDRPICTTIDPDVAQAAILNGEINRVVVNYDNDVETATDPRWGPVLARLDYTDGRCGNLPQGIMSRDAITLVLGTIYLYNETTTQPQIEISLSGSDKLDAALFATPTPIPTATSEPTATTEPTATSAATETPEPTATTAIIILPPTEEPIASPSDATPAPDAATPGATPEATGTPVI